MIHAAPQLEPIDQVVLSMIHQQRERLRIFERTSNRRWYGSLRRSTLARAIQGSNSIEGYHASVDEAIAAIANEPPAEGVSETWWAIKGYRDALTYILQAAQDPYFEFSKQFLKSLHFMMIGHEMAKHPGQWRPGSIFIVNMGSGDTVYQAPDVEMVNPLVEELVTYLKANTDEPSIIRGAMAHLNLTMIHPFKDGNGRMARALQTLVIAQDGMLTPEFCSIEEWLGANTEDYYQVLAQVGQGSWNPQHDTLPWIRFCLRAHFQQCAKLIRRNEEYGVIYEHIRAICAREKLPERMELPVFDVCLGSKMTNTRYRGETEVSEFVASRDLKRLTELGLLEPQGENRGRRYGPGKELVEIRRASRTPRNIADPYEIVRQSTKARSSTSVEPDPAVQMIPGL